MYRFFLLVLFLFSCDQFEEGTEKRVQPSFISQDDLVKLDCSVFFMMKKKISKVKFYKNNKLLKQVSGFEIQQARHCPSLAFDQGRDKIEIDVSFHNNDGIQKCEIVKGKLKCHKNY